MSAAISAPRNPGAVLIVRDGKQLRPAVLLVDRGKKLELALGDGRARPLSPNKIMLDVGVDSRATDLATADAWLADWDLETARAAIELEPAWELAVEDGDGLELDDLAELLLPEPAPLARAALFLELEADTTYFRRKGDSYEPRPADEVAATKAGEATKAARRQARADFLARLEAARTGDAQAYDGAGATDDPVRDEHQRQLDDLRALALGRDESTEGRRAAKLLRDAPGFPTNPEGAFKALVALGVWGRDEDIPLIATGRRASPPSPAEAEARELPDEHPQDDRVDLRQLDTVAVDDAWTADPDDALSFAVEGDLIRLWIHVTAASELIPAGGALDRAAFDAGASLYRPDGRLSMLPQVAEDRLALHAGKDRAALTLELLVDPASGEVREQIPQRALIRVDRRQTYDEVDALIAAGDPGWTRVIDACRALEATRIASGATSFSLTELKVELGPDPEPANGDPREVRLVPLDSSTASRKAIAELMVQSGRCWADHAIAHELPVVYRRQDPPTEALPARDDFPSTYAWFFVARRQLSKGRLSSMPGPHAGLGLQAYVQATSPLRRYQDMATQRQLVNQLAGRPIADADELLRAAAAADQAARECSRLERSRTEHWLLRYLEPRLGQTLGATVVGALPGSDDRYAVLLDEVLLERPIRSSVELPVGQRVEVKLNGMSLFARTLHIGLAQVLE